MAKKKYKKADKCCETCMNLMPIGEGDHICEEDPTRMVLEDYTLAEDYFWCNGRKWGER